MRSNHSGNDGCDLFNPVLFYVSVGFIQIRIGRLTRIEPADFFYSALCYLTACFFFLLTTVVPITVPPLMNSNAIHSVRLLLSPV